MDGVPSLGPLVLSIGEARVSQGVWRAVLRGPEGKTPRLVATCLGRELSAPVIVEAGEAPGFWHAQLALPMALLEEGMRTVLITQEGESEVLAHFAVMAGAPFDSDLKAEVDLLRAELDLLKRAFRRHCSENH
ncbi:MAG: hypothetical protein AAGF74_01430 [Pseudomonadota bacterium]